MWQCPRQPQQSSVQVCKLKINARLQSLHRSVWKLCADDCLHPYVLQKKLNSVFCVHLLTFWSNGWKFETACQFRKCGSALGGATQMQRKLLKNVAGEHSNRKRDVFGWSKGESAGASDSKFNTQAREHD